jgi:SAM-dependent methyltransferase
MTKQTFSNKVQFDEFAGDYDAALAHGLNVSGEDKNYFAQGRVAWLAACLGRLDEKPRRVMDFGCGTGSAEPFLAALPGVESVLGLDTSTKSLEVARRTCAAERAQFLPLNRYDPGAAIDLAFCNGVFHHVPVSERSAAMDYVYRALRPGGLFAIWENNPWNPGARYVMSRIPFDRDAVMLAPAETRRMLRAGGFQILRTDFLFIFPRMLRWLRGVEPWVARLPIGAQYQVLARKL